MKEVREALSPAFEAGGGCLRSWGEFKSKGSTYLEIRVSKVRGLRGISADQTGMWEGPCTVMAWRQSRSLACDAGPASYTGGVSHHRTIQSPGGDHWNWSVW